MESLNLEKILFSLGPLLISILSSFDDVLVSVSAIFPATVPDSLLAHRQLAENRPASRQTTALPSAHVRPLTLDLVKTQVKTSL